MHLTRFTLLILFVYNAHSIRADVRKDNWTVLPQIKVIQFPNGYDVIDNQGTLLKSLPDARSARVQAFTSWEGSQIYISDWSYARYLQGLPPNWIRPRPTLTTNPGLTSATQIVAVLVGNGDYNESDQSKSAPTVDLPNALNDVDLLASTFAALGVQPILLKNASLDVLSSTVAKTVRMLTPDTVFFFYFAGHGLQVSGENFLVPVGNNRFDSPDSIAESCFGLGQLLQELGKHDFRLAIIALDCCRENPFQPDAETARPGRGIDGKSLTADGPSVGLAEITAPANTLISFATSPGAVAADGVKGEDKNSPYASALAKALTRDLEIRTMFEMAGREVKTLTENRQNPWKSNDSFSEFYFRNPNRRIATPNSFALLASRAITTSGEFGVPSAVAYLAASVRENPRNSPSCFALAYLLAYNAIPLPIRRVGQKGYDPQGEQLAIHDGHATLGNLALESRTLDGHETQRGPLVTDFPREDFVYSGGHAAFQLPKPQPSIGVDASADYSRYAVTPVRLRGRMESLIFLPKLRRIFFDEHVYEGWSLPSEVHLYEMATSEPVRLRLETTNVHRAISIWSESDSTTVPLGSSGLVLTIRNNQRNHTSISIHSPAESPEVWTPISPGKDGYTRFLGYSHPNKQIALALGYTEGEHPLDTLCLVELHSRKVRLRKNPFTSNFLEVSPDGEWLFTYDSLHRPVLFDFATGGEALHFIGTRCNEPLPVDIPLVQGPSTASAASPTGVPAPRLFEWLPDLYEAPPWLPDLAESLVGFRINGLGETEFLDNPNVRLRNLLPSLQKGVGCNLGYKLWTDWMLEHRLAALREKDN